MQLAGVPVPTTFVGVEVSSGWASGGTTAVPAGLAMDSGRGLGFDVVVVGAGVVVVVVVVGSGLVANGCGDEVQDTSTTASSAHGTTQRRDMVRNPREPG
ncbi:hypothetical protein GCM10010492_61570 [Saccharothrix mutabilis subsp. mutabilis]|uniref:Uncharacterized protein n=1 Tax=Saccharothrix mutabilis subsp. mutabilis TaxID=66855 RepID=A0ABP3E5H8_9PSEU